MYINQSLTSLSLSSSIAITVYFLKKKIRCLTDVFLLGNVILVNSKFPCEKQTNALNYYQSLDIGKQPNKNVDNIKNPK